MKPFRRIRLYGQTNGTGNAVMQWPVPYNGHIREVSWSMQNDFQADAETHIAQLSLAATILNQANTVNEDVLVDEVRTGFTIFTAAALEAVIQGSLVKVSRPDFFLRKDQILYLHQFTTPSGTITGHVFITFQ